MPELYFEDFTAGAALPEAELTVSAEDAAFFASAFGPGAGWPGAAEGGSTLSGWHVAALGMRLLFDAVLSRTAGLGGPGVDAVTWPRPVRVGDRLRFTGRVSAVRPSASRPGMGLVTLAIALLDGDSACVMTQENTVMVARRRGGAGQDDAEAAA